MSRRWWGPRAGLAAVLASVAVIGALAWPMLFTNSSFGGDWLHHLWVIWHQRLNISANHAPSFFINSSSSVYYPLYAFYGGTIYTLTAALALVPGSSLDTAYVISYLMGLAAAYGGWYWMGRLAGLGRWFAQAPALAFVTAAPFLTLIYGRGDWPEFLGVTMIPLMIASGASLVRTERPRAGPLLALACSSVIFFGSHGLTTLWGSTIIAITAVIVLACVPRARPAVNRASVARLAVVIIPALLVSAWFLLPTVAYSSNTHIGNSYARSHQILRETIHLVSWRYLLTLSRAYYVPGTGFVLSLPILVIAWGIVSILVLAYPSRASPWLRVLLILAGVTTAVTILMVSLGLLLALPKPYSLLQFSYRLENYILLGLSGVVLAVLVVAQRSTGRLRLWRWTLVPVLGVSVVGAIQQVDAYPRAIPRQYLAYGPLDEAFSQRFRDYGDVSLPVVNGGSFPQLKFPFSAIHHDRISGTVHLAPGQRVSTNIDTGPYLLHITGAKAVARNHHGFLVLEIPRPAPAADAPQRAAAARTETISLGPPEGLAVVLGRILTLVGVLVLAAEIAVALVRRRRRGGARS